MPRVSKTEYSSDEHIRNSEVRDNRTIMARNLRRPYNQDDSAADSADFAVSLPHSRIRIHHFHTPVQEICRQKQMKQ